MSPSSSQQGAAGTTQVSSNNPAGLDDFVPLSQMNLPEPESSSQKFKRKMMEEPLVPVGRFALSNFEGLHHELIEAEHRRAGDYCSSDCS